MRLIFSAIDFILYTNLWIATGAYLLFLQTTVTLNQKFESTALASLVFFSSIFLYSLHRAIGLEKVKTFDTSQTRFAKITSLKSSIYILGLSSLLVTLYLVLQLDSKSIYYLLAPSIISILYVLPVLNEKKRLRDQNLIKIFLVAFTWAWITVILPWMESAQQFTSTVLILFLERACFIFAITLPFDIRDMEIDKLTEVKTIPQKLGLEKTKFLAFILIVLAIMLSVISYFMDIYSGLQCLSLLASYLLCLWLIPIIVKKKHDYYFTGLLDGTIILLGGLFLLASMS